MNKYISENRLVMTNENKTGVVTMISNNPTPISTAKLFIFEKIPNSITTSLFNLSFHPFSLPISTKSELIIFKGSIIFSRLHIEDFSIIRIGSLK